MEQSLTWGQDLHVTVCRWRRRFVSRSRGRPRPSRKAVQWGMQGLMHHIHGRKVDQVGLKFESFVPTCHQQRRVSSKGTCSRSTQGILMVGTLRWQSCLGIEDSSSSWLAGRGPSRSPCWVPLSVQEVKMSKSPCLGALVRKRVMRLTFGKSVTTQFQNGWSLSSNCELWPETYL